MNTACKVLTAIFDQLDKAGVKPLLDENAEDLERAVLKYVLACIEKKSAERLDLNQVRLNETNK